MPAATVFEAMYRDPSQGLGRYLFLFFLFCFIDITATSSLLEFATVLAKLKDNSATNARRMHHHAPSTDSSILEPSTNPWHRHIDAKEERMKEEEEGVQITIHATHCRENCPPLEGAVPCSNGFPVKFHFHVPLCRSTACSAPSNVPT